MNKISYPQLVKNIADAYRTVIGSTDPIVIGELTTKVTEAMNSGGSTGESVAYKSITYNEDNTITLIDSDDVEHTMSCVYEEDKITSITYDSKVINLTYDNDTLVSINNTEINLDEAPVADSGSGDSNTELEDALVSRTLTTYSNDRVTEIGEYTFAECFPLNSVDIPNVISIGDYAFMNCDKLTSFTIPDNLGKFRSEIFEGCSKISEYIASDNCVNFSTDNGVLYSKDKTKLVSIPVAYSDNYGKHFITPDYVTTLNRKFLDTGIKYITIPSTVTTINTDAFANADSYLIVFVEKGSTAQSYTYGGNRIYVITSNTDDAKKMSFEYDSGYRYKIVSYSGTTDTTITFPDYVNNLSYYFSIGDYCCDGLTQLTSIVMPNYVHSIGAYAFRNCALTELPSILSNTYFGDYTFYGCAFEVLTLSNNNLYAAAGTFSNCKNLTTVYYGGTNSINSSIFEECENLKHLVLSASSQVTINETALTNTPIANGEGYIYVPSKQLSGYQSTYPDYTFRTVTNYTVDGTTTGLLDESKI